MVAVKELYARTRDGRAGLQFDREVQTMATLRHPAILPLQGFTEFSGDGKQSAAILMPLMSRGSLADVLTPKGLSK
jgi:serine/threonine protein kinase